MYERFTDRARHVMQFANQEAMRFNHEYIGTEHILLGLVKEGTGVAATVFKNLSVDLLRVRLEVEKIAQVGPDWEGAGKLPSTPKAKKVLEYSIDEARKLNHNYVGTEHLLLGLLRDDASVAAQVLLNLGLSLTGVRNEILRLLGVPPETQNPADVTDGGHELSAGMPHKASDRIPWDVQADKYLGVLIVLFELMKAGAVASQEFDRAAQLKNMADDLRRIQEFLQRDRHCGQ